MKIKKIVAFVLSFTMAMSMLAGCGKDKEQGSSEAGGDVTLTFFDKNSGSKIFDDNVAKAIMEKTGVKIAVENPTGDPSEKLNLMLSGQNYPDIVLMELGEITNRYIEADALIELDDLIDQYAPNVKDMYGETLDKSKYSDGKTYYLNNWYGEDPDASCGILMRRDYLAEIVGEERAESPEPFTQSEFMDILKEFKELHPTINGAQSIAVTLDSEAKNYEGPLYGMFGLKQFYENGDNLQHRAKDPEYVKAMMFMNDLSSEGLLDKEWVVNKTEQWQQKLSSGNVFCTFSSYWDVDGVNTTMASTIGPEAQFYSYKVVADGLDPSETTYNGRNYLGWDAIGITKNCKNVEAAMRFIDFLVSEEGQYLMMWGIEGKDWTMEDGKHVPNEETLSALKSDFDTTSNDIGIRKWTWFIKNGYGSDGTPYDLSTKYDMSATAAFANESFRESDGWDSSDFSGLEPAGSTPGGLKWQKTKDIYDQTYSKIVDAADNDAAMKVYSDMIDKMNQAGLEECETYISEQYQERLKRWKEAE